jgi:hypothetical protein
MIKSLLFTFLLLPLLFGFNEAKPSCNESIHKGGMFERYRIINHMKYHLKLPDNEIIKLMDITQEDIDDLKGRRDKDGTIRLD